jgi:hypothetical protein
MDDLTLVIIVGGLFILLLYAILIHSIARIAKSMDRLNKIIDSGVPVFQLKEERCPKCKAENPYGWRFCGKCGKESPYGYNCTDCGQPALEDQKYCTYCGKKFDGKE